MRACMVGLIGLFVAGCPPEDGCERASLDRAQPIYSALTVTGKPTRFAMGIACTSGITSVTSVATDREGQVAPSEVVSFSQSGGALIELTAINPGPHTIVARFEPLGAEARVTTHVMRDRSAEPPVLRFSQPGGCSQVEIAGGLVACLTGFDLKVIWDGGIGAQLARTVRSSGDALWATSSDGVQRWAPVDGGVETALLVTDMTNVLPRVAATRPNELLLSDFGLLFSVVATDGGLSRRPLDYARDYAMRGGLAISDGGVHWLSGTETCFGAPSQPARCRPWTFDMMASEDEYLWVHDLMGSDIGIAQFANGPGPASLQLFRIDPRAQAELKFSNEGVPSSRFQDSLVTLDRDTLRLDAWKGPAGWESGGATATHVWFRVGSQYTVYAR